MSQPHECGGCRHLNLNRCGAGDAKGANWCDERASWQWRIGLTDCPTWELRSCGNCVVFNPHPTYENGGCSIHGPRHRDDPPCRHYFGMRQLSLPAYGRERRAEG